MHKQLKVYNLLITSIEYKPMTISKGLMVTVTKELCYPTEREAFGTLILFLFSQF